MQMQSKNKEGLDKLQNLIKRLKASVDLIYIILEDDSAIDLPGAKVPRIRLPLQPETQYHHAHG